MKKRNVIFTIDAEQHIRDPQFTIASIHEFTLFLSIFCSNFSTFFFWFVLVEKISRAEQDGVMQL